MWKDKILYKIYLKLPQLKDNPAEAEEYLSKAFTELMMYTNASAYNESWDNILIECVVRIYNYVGSEGTISTDNEGISVSYSSINPVEEYLTSVGMPSYVIKCGKTLSSSRFDYPD